MALFPITGADVEGYLGVGPGSPADATALEDAAAAASEWVADRVLGWDGAAPLPTDVTAPVRQGAKLLAARWYARRTSVNGVATFGELGVSQVVRADPDVARLLGLGRPGVA